MINKKWKIDISKLKPGDLIFTREKGQASLAVRATTLSAYSHVLIAGKNTSVEATGDGGVYLCNLHRKTFSSKNDLRVMRHNKLKSDPELQNHVFRMAEYFSGGVYDTTAAIKSHPSIRNIKIFKPSSIESFYCSKLATLSYFLSGIDLFNKKVDVTPKDLYKHNDFFEVEDVAFELDSSTPDPYEGKTNFPYENSKKSVDLIRKVRTEIPESIGQVYTLNTLYDFALARPDHDEKIFELSKSSDFFLGLKNDKIQNSHRYDFLEYRDGIKELLKKIDLNESHIKRFLLSCELPQLKAEIKKFISYYIQFDKCLEKNSESYFFKYLKVDFVGEVLKDLSDWSRNVMTIIPPQELNNIDSEFIELASQVNTILTLIKIKQ